MARAYQGHSVKYDQSAPKRMDYRQQQAYLRNSRIRGLLAVVIILAAAAGCASLGGLSGGRVLIVYALVSLALAASTYYTPDYLHLSVVPDKGARWQAKLRWRIAAAVLLLGLAASHTTWTRWVVMIAAGWIALGNFAVSKLAPARFHALLHCGADVLLIGSLIVSRTLPLLLGSLLLAVAAHLAYVSAERDRLGAIRYGIFGCLALIVFLRVHTSELNLMIPCAALVVLVAAFTHWLRDQAGRQNARNIAAAIEELAAFTGYTPQRIRELWENSNQQLAKNWEEAAIPHDDRERMAEWYRQNSELYLFAISAYNLEYKRIKSNLKVIGLARGSTLDYGAGNGEILLELARRGHSVTYFDVEGATMRFARSRAAQQKLAVNFARSKDELRAAAQPLGFNTIFSFDVLEHLPDLPGELTFLSSLLSPGGLFVFDVPAGSTKAHPMHLNHDLNVVDYLKGKGLKDRRGLYLRMPFRKEEKWVFEA